MVLVIEQVEFATELPKDEGGGELVAPVDFENIESASFNISISTLKGDFQSA